MAKTYLRTGRISWSPLTASQQTMLANVAGIAIGSTFSATLDSPTETFLIGNGVISVPSSAVVASSGDTVGTVPVDNGDGTYSWGAASGSGVTTFNTRSGAVTLSKADVTGTGLAAADVSADASGAAAAAQAAAIAASAQGLVPTAVKTTNYSAAAGDFVPVDASGGVVTVTLPSAPADKTRIGVKIIAQAGTPNTVTIARGGSDVFNKAGGSTSLTLSALFQSVLLQYQSSTGIWYAQSTDYQLPASVVNGSADTLVTAKGDLPVGASNGVRAIVPVGSNAQVLTADSTQTDGVKWASAPAPSPSTGLNAYSQYFQMTGYGVVADAVTSWNGAMTSGSAVLTDSTTSPFKVGDVGKPIVVNNALGSGVHLYTTILSYQSASQVTLNTNATATVATALYSYGTDNTTAAQNCINAAAAASGVVLLPAAAFAVNGVLNITAAVSFQGLGVNVIGGSYATNQGVVVIPIKAPFLAGSVIVQLAASTDVLYIKNTIGAETVNLRSFGVMFAGLFKTTGHGIHVDAPVVSSYKDCGLQNYRWDDLCVLGADGTHYAYYQTNCQYGTISHTACWGGGGFCFENNSANPFGNSVLTDNYVCQMGVGTGFKFLPTLGAPNLFTFIRPQTIRGTTYTGTLFNGWSLGAPTFSIDAGSATRVGVYGMDLEGPPLTGAFNSGNQGWTFDGSVYDPSSNVTAQGIGGNVLYDNAQFWKQMGPYGGTRRLNRDGTVCIDAAENAGSALWLARINPNGQKVFGITTDGTDKQLIPGKLTVSGGNGPYNPTPGAALGTYTAGSGAPPLVRLSGTDAAGTLAFGSGTTPATGTIATLTFGVAYASVPVPTLAPMNAATVALGLYITPTKTGFTVGCTTAPTASQAVGTYQFAYEFSESGTGNGIPAIYDSFTRANSGVSLGTADSGGAWTAATGTWGISSNQAALISGATGIAVQNVGTADFTVDLDFPTYAGAPGIVFRYSSTSAFWFTNANQLVYYNGSFNTVAQWSPVMANGNHMTVICQGSTITVRVNGVTVYTGVQTFNQSATSAGIRSDSTSALFDNFSAG